MTADERKKEIRQAAMRVFVEKGFRNTVMNDIMEATGLSRGGLYHHYGSTYEILYDIMAQGNKYRFDMVKHSLDDKNDINMGFIADLIVEKMLADNLFIPLYVIFLCEKKDNDKLENLYERLKREVIKSVEECLQKTIYSFKSENSLEYLTNLINSMILACQILGLRENFIENKAILKEMVLVFLKDNLVEG